MKKIGLVLSGGGIRGFAHLGLLQVLDELGIPLHAISGVSAGAIVGAFYAAGYKPKQILELMKDNSYFGFSNFSFRGNGFFSMQPLYKSLQKYIPEDSFESLSMPLYVTATDFNKNKSVVFSKGKLYDAIAASAALPVIFQPVVCNNSLMVDGGILDNFPTGPLAEKCDELIGCYVNKLRSIKGEMNHIGKAGIFERCIDMATCGNTYLKKQYCSVFLEPALDQFNMLDMRKAGLMFDIGYKTALKQKNRLLALPG